MALGGSSHLFDLICTLSAPPGISRSQVDDTDEWLIASVYRAGIVGRVDLWEGPFVSDEMTAAYYPQNTPSARTVKIYKMAFG